MRNARPLPSHDKYGCWGTYDPYDVEEDGLRAIPTFGRVSFREFVVLPRRMRIQHTQSHSRGGVDPIGPPVYQELLTFDSSDISFRFIESAVLVFVFVRFSRSDRFDIPSFASRFNTLLLLLKFTITDKYIVTFL